MGTPGRFVDLLQKGHLVVDSVRLFILDEADKLMDDGMYLLKDWEHAKYIFLRNPNFGQ